MSLQMSLLMLRRPAAARTVLLAAAIASAAIAPAHAGRACEEQMLTAVSLDEALTMGTRLQAALDATGSDVALIAREGQDLSQYKLKYSHAGLALRAAPGQPWRVYELLNDCGTATSSLWVDGLANFFLDQPYTLDALVMVPPPAVAANLGRLLRNPAALQRLHGARYSMVAYPYATTYQNSNQWVLEVLAAGSAADSGGNSTDGSIVTGGTSVTGRTGQPTARGQAQDWLKAAGYQPTEMHLGPLARLGGRMFKANIAFDDHPGSLRYAGRINVVTVDSVQTFLQRQGWATQQVRGTR